MTTDATPPPASPDAAAADPAAAPRGRAGYGVPALEKGLDVLELLAGLSYGISPSEIAQRLGRSLQEVYRVLLSLERRGYIQRRPLEDGYVLSWRLAELAMRHPPVARLQDLVRPILQTATAAADQAMHVAVLDHHDIRIVAQEDSPAPLGFRLRLGTRALAVGTASGRVLIAYARPDLRALLLDRVWTEGPPDRFAAATVRIARIRSVGHECVAGEGLQGVTDVSFPLLDRSGEAVAALTMPFLSATAARVGFDAAVAEVARAAATVTRLLGGEQPPLGGPVAPDPDLPTLPRQP